MKNFFILTLICTVGIVACRKKVLRDEEIVDVFPVAHCIDYEMNGDEIGYNCGGADCDSCTQTIPLCAYPDDNLHVYDFGGWGYVNYAITSTTVTGTTGSWVFKAETISDYDYLYIEFSSKPDVTKIYNGTFDGFSITESEVFVKYEQYSGPVLYGDGDVYVNYYNGVYTIQACDYTFQPSGGPAVAGPQYFNISFN